MDDVPWGIRFDSMRVVVPVSGMARPRSSEPQLAVWAERAGSVEKRCLADLALARGLAPVSLASRVDMDQRDLGRWFKRAGNGDGRILRAVAGALKTTPLEVRVRVSPESLTIDDLARAERELLSDIRSNVDAYPDAKSFAKSVKAKLATCRPETRRMVLTRYAQGRVQQEEGLTKSVAALYADLDHSISSPTDFAATKARRDALPQPAPYHAAQEAAIATLQRFAGLSVPLKIPGAASALVKELLAYARSLEAFKDCRTGERFFNEARVSRLVDGMLIALGKAGWPPAIRAAAREQYQSYLRRQS